MYAFFSAALIMLVAGILDYKLSPNNYDNLKFYSKLSAINTDSSTEICIQNYVGLTETRSFGCKGGTITNLTRFGIIPANNMRNGSIQLTSCPAMTPSNSYWNQ